MITIAGCKTVQHQRDCSILETVENHGIEIHSQCRDGFCGACRTRILSGEVEYTSDPLAFFDDDEILPCCSVPKSDIEIKIE